MKKTFCSLLFTGLALLPPVYAGSSLFLSPGIIKSVPNVELSIDEGTVSLDLSEYFHDPGEPGATLQFSLVRNSDPDVASVLIESNTLSVEPLSPGQTSVIISAGNSGFTILDTFAVGVRPLIDGNYEVATFEDLSLETESYWNGADEQGNFVSGTAMFVNNYNPDWFAWDGWAYSNTNDVTTPGYMNQYSAISPVRLDSTIGKNYGLSYVIGESEIRLAGNADRLVKGFFVTNSTYAALSMKLGDDFSKKFGGTGGNDPDFFKLTVTGHPSDGDPSSIDFYLADYTFEDNGKDYILETWQWVDLSSLGKVTRLTFSLSSSDNGIYGMNTPAFFCMDNLCLEPLPASSSFLSEVIEYLPAPSQYMNSFPWGAPSAASSLFGGLEGHVSLGAFGGYIVFRFDHPVINDPGNPFGVDFTLFGNPVPGWSEPGIVSVMKDKNGNGLADDTWYELAGSDHIFSSTIRGYEVVYTNPGGDEGADVPWSDNQGNEGSIIANSFYTQPYYPMADSFPVVDREKYTLEGTMIRSSVDTNNLVQLNSTPRSFGYADNRGRGSEPWNVPDNPYTAETENSGGDAFDISWAVDDEGKYVELDRIDFIRVHTGVMEGAGLLGQLTTEITGAVDVAPASEISGPSELVVIRDLPAMIVSDSFPLEVFVFRNGRIQPDEEIVWESDSEWAAVDENGILRLEGSGELTLTAMMQSNPGIYASASTVVDLVQSLSAAEAVPLLLVFPDPAIDQVTLRGPSGGRIRIVNLQGQVLRTEAKETDDLQINVSALPAGVYFIEYRGESLRINSRFIKR